MISINSFLKTDSQGVFNCGDFISDLNDKKLIFKSFVNKNSESVVLSLNIKNLNEINLSLNSIVLADFVVKDNPIKILQNSWTQSGFSGYTNGIKPTKRKKLFLTRDQNPFSFRNDYGYLENSQISEWYTQLIFKNYSMVVGALTLKDQYAQIFIKKVGDGIRVRVTCQLDGIIIKPGETVKSEKIAFIVGEKDTVLNKFAELVKKENKIANLPKPVKGLCCAYYAQGNYVDEDYVLNQLNVIDNFPMKPRFDVVQIDGLPTPWGDWEESWNKLFPGGLDLIVKEIKKSGCKAGFWIAPFVASPQSKIFGNHPDWFLKNKGGKHFEARFTSPLDKLPVLSLRALDPTHPKVQEHVSDLIKKMIEYGFSYIKTDFTYPQGFATNFHKNVTRAQALREGFEVIRKASGNEALIQSSITQISPLVGLVDYVRTGIDTLNPFVCKIPIVNKIVNENMIKQDLRNSESRNFFHNIVWVLDPDIAVFRGGTGISEDLIAKHKNFALTNKTSRWVGEDLTKLDNGQRNSLIGFVA